MPSSACTSPNDLVKPSTRIAGCSPTPLTCDIHPPVPALLHARAPARRTCPVPRRPGEPKISASRTAAVVIRRKNHSGFIGSEENHPRPYGMIEPAIRGEELRMSEQNRHEAADLEDYSVQEPADSLTGEPGEPGDDPLDRGVAPPERWSSVIRNADEPESLDQLLDEEEPDPALEFEDDDVPEGSASDDEDEADEYVDGLLLDDGPDPRAGRLVAEDEGAHSDDEEDLVATDVGIDGGAASAEEAAIHVVEDDDTDIRSGD